MTIVSDDHDQHAGGLMYFSLIRKEDYKQEV